MRGWFASDFATEVPSFFNLILRGFWGPEPGGLAQLAIPRLVVKDYAAVLVVAADHLEQVRGGLAGHRQVAELVDLCGYRTG